MGNPVTVAVIGAGNRGSRVYGEYILNHPDDIKAVAIAEPDLKRRSIFAKKHNIEEKYQFDSWTDMFSREKVADGVIIATMDTMHISPAIKTLEKGYKILLEKPIATKWSEISKLQKRSKDLDGQILVAHVLRYTPFYHRLKEILADGLIGTIRLVDHIENIGYYHFAHSYVRGNWRNTKEAAPIILAKSCHDMDLIDWLLEKRCLELSSSASLEYFTEDNFPKGAADRCLDCSVVEDCPYAAQKIYLTEEEGWPVSVITDDLSYDGRIRALKEGPYGRCVFKCDNNVPEVQTVRMTMEDNIEVNFALTAFSSQITRRTSFYGSLGEIQADFEEGEIIIDRFGFDRKIIKVSAPGEGHGGGDTGLMDYFVKFLEKENIQSGDSTSLDASIESHKMAFAAEESRIDEKTVKLSKNQE